MRLSRVLIGSRAIEVVEELDAMVEGSSSCEKSSNTVKDI